MLKIPPIFKTSLLSVLLVVIILVLVANAEDFDLTGNELTSGFSFDNGQLSVYSWDRNLVSAYGNDDMGLFKNMKTALSQTDSSIDKLRKVSMFTFGANKLDIADTSILNAQDNMNNMMSTGFERYSTLTDKNGMMPFGLIAEDFETLSTEGLGQGLSQGMLNTKITLILPDTFDPVKADKFVAQLNSLNTNMHTTFDVKLVNFNSYEDMLSLYGASWGEWFSVFNDPEVWAPFKEALKNGDDELTYEEIMNSHYKESNGGITCVWGSNLYTRTSV